MEDLMYFLILGSWCFRSGLCGVQVGLRLVWII